MMKKTLLTAMTAVLAAGMAFMVSCGTKSEKPEEFPVETPVETPVEEEKTPTEEVQEEAETGVETPVEGPSEEAQETESQGSDIDAPETGEENAPSATKPAETKPAEPKPVETKPSTTAPSKPAETKPTTPTPKPIPTPTPAPTPTPTPKPTPTPAPVVTTKTETKTESIAFQTVRQDDPTLEKGKEVVAQNGVNGTRTITYTVTYTDGKETGRTVASDKVTKEPVNQIIKVGTKEVVAQRTWKYRADFSRETFNELNRFRANEGLPALQLSSAAEAEAKAWAEELAKRNSGADHNPVWKLAGEIVLVTSVRTNPQQFIQAFAGSPGHVRSLRTETATKAGAGVYEDSNGMFYVVIYFEY